MEICKEKFSTSDTHLETNSYCRNTRCINTDDQSQSWACRSDDHDFKSKTSASADSCLHCPNCTSKLQIRVVSMSSIDILKCRMIPHTENLKTTPDESGDCHSNQQPTTVKNKKSVWSEVKHLESAKVIGKYGNLTTKNSCFGTSQNHFDCFVQEQSPMFGPVKPLSFSKSTNLKQCRDSSVTKGPKNANLKSTSFTVVPSTSFASRRPSSRIPQAFHKKQEVTAPPSVPANATTDPENVSLDVLEQEASSLKGLDNVEAATLYESSESSSDESLTKQSEKVPPPTISPEKANSNVSIKTLQLSVSESEGDEGTPREQQHAWATPDVTTSKTFEYDIPEYRRNIYKDSLSLFLYF